MSPVTADPGLSRSVPADVQRIPDIYAAKRAAGRPVISIEFFPPKTPQGDESLFDRVLPRLAEVRPDFCSVTYGAGGGGTRARTLQIVDRVQREHGVTAMAHVTCSSFTRAGMDGFLDEAAGLGIRNILALRGDPPATGAGFEPPEGGFDYAYQLIDVLRARASEFAIGCAGFPEGHPDCAEGREVDWVRLRDKIDHGAQFVLTQLFFDNADYFAMVDHLTGALGVTVPNHARRAPDPEHAAGEALHGALRRNAAAGPRRRSRPARGQRRGRDGVRHRLRVPPVRGAPSPAARRASTSTASTARAPPSPSSATSVSRRREAAAAPQVAQGS